MTPVRRTRNDSNDRRCTTLRQRHGTKVMSSRNVRGDRVTHRELDRPQILILARTATDMPG
jgi:hypothetical protein